MKHIQNFTCFNEGIIDFFKSNKTESTIKSEKTLEMIISNIHKIYDIKYTNGYGYSFKLNRYLIKLSDSKIIISDNEEVVIKKYENDKIERLFNKIYDYVSNEYNDLELKKYRDTKKIKEIDNDKKSLEFFQQNDIYDIVMDMYNDIKSNYNVTDYVSYNNNKLHLSDPRFISADNNKKFETPSHISIDFTEKVVNIQYGYPRNNEVVYSNLYGVSIFNNLLQEVKKEILLNKKRNLKSKKGFKNK